VTWIVKRYSRSTDWHNNAGFHCHFFNSIWDRLKRRPYKFEYKLESTPNNQAKLCLPEQAITLGGHSVWEWLASRAIGNIYWTADCQDHVVSSIGSKSVARTTMTIEFSDKQLAMLWKMTWGN
jgi:hypothetical protein